MPEQCTPVTIFNRPGDGNNWIMIYFDQFYHPEFLQDPNCHRLLGFCLVSQTSYERLF